MESMTEIWTIGHSTHSAADFIAMLRANEIEALADVRQFPGSRRYPHFNREPLSEMLAQEGVEYVHFPELGGRRRPRPDSPNDAWRNDSFRGYADYMMTDAFLKGIERLSKLAGRKRTSIMCAEVLWWRCHRALISDFLKAHGARVHHIGGSGKVQDHPFTSAARIVGGKLTYNASESPLEFQFQ